MDILGIIDLPIWLVTILMFVFTTCMYTWHKQNFFKNLGINTKPTTFLFGDLGILMKKGMTYLDVEMMEKNGKVFGFFVGNIPLLCVSDADMVKQIMVKDFNKFPHREVQEFPVAKLWKSSLSLATGTHWKFIRSTLSPSFSTGKLRHMTGYINRCLTNLQEALDEKIMENPQGFDITPFVRCHAMDVICSTGFGLDANAQKEPDNPFIKHARDIFGAKLSGSPLRIILMIYPDLSVVYKASPRHILKKELFDFFAEITKSAFQERKSSTSKHRDLLQQFINAHEGDLGSQEDNSENAQQMTMDDFKKRGLTDDEVLTNSIIFMIAGYETNASTMTWLVYALVAYPECQERLLREIDSEIGSDAPTYDNVFKLTYLDMFVKETLRVHPVTSALARVPIEDVDVCGVTLKKEVAVVMPTSILHFMPEYWENPKKFDPERFSPENKKNINEYAYMPFGQGPRNCIGMRLALLEVKMTIVSLLQKYRIFKTDDLEVPMPMSTSNIQKPAKPVSVRLEKRHQVAN